MNTGVIYTALSGVLYGSIGYFGATLLASGLSLPNLLLWRFLLSAIFLLPLAVRWYRARNEIHFGSLAKLFVLGAVFYGGSTALYFEASTYIGTGLAMVIFFAYPIVVLFLSTFFHKSRFTRVTVISLVLIVLGCSMIAVGQSLPINMYGLLLAVLSGVGYAVYVFFSKEASRSVPPTLATFSVCTGGILFFLGMMFWFGDSLQAPSTSFQLLNATLFSVMGTVLPVMLMLLGLRTISASKASIISVLEPVTTLIVGSLVLGEAISSMQYVGALIILCSAVFVQLEKESPRRTQTG